MTNSFRVGDIVITNDEQTERTGFVEEIIIDPSDTYIIKPHRQGKFSLYCLNKDEYVNGSRFYIGDTMGDSMRATGEVVTGEMLQSIIDLVPENKGIARDFPIVIRNIGRKSGRNQ